TFGPTPSLRPAAPQRAARESLPLLLLPRVLERRGDGLDLDVGELAVHLAHFAQIFVLHDVARLGIDRNRAARTVRILVGAEDLHRFVCVELALLRLD